MKCYCLNCTTFSKICRHTVLSFDLPFFLFFLFTFLLQSLLIFCICASMQVLDPKCMSELETSTEKKKNNWTRSVINMQKNPPCFTLMSNSINLYAWLEFNFISLLCSRNAHMKSMSRLWHLSCFMQPIDSATITNTMLFQRHKTPQELNLYSEWIKLKESNNEQLIWKTPQ